MLQAVLVCCAYYPNWSNQSSWIECIFADRRVYSQPEYETCNGNVVMIALAMEWLMYIKQLV